MKLHVNSNLREHGERQVVAMKLHNLVFFCVWNRKAICYFHGFLQFSCAPQQCADNTLLTFMSSRIMIQDAKNDYWMNVVLGI